jgi:uncharacterized membrane protein (DUF373 family)
MADRLPGNWRDVRREWAILSMYERFECLIALLLRIVLGAVIVVAFYRLLVSVIDTLVLRSLNPLEHPVFQQVFGEIMTLLIALEFNHTLQYGITPQRGIIQARIVILIAILALARKIIILDLSGLSASMMGGLAALTLGLGVAYWLVGERDDHLRKSDEEATPDRRRGDPSELRLGGASGAPG